ncbi:Transcriptional regulator RPN4 [Apiospora rasikravindrae]|uniref:Transcriptional regulator RPN4 n=1 Tax=Apiospora rasikravindrae TaxID=990691 RepID=A0ABR1T065_9PEZI
MMLAHQHYTPSRTNHLHNHHNNPSSFAFDDSTQYTNNFPTTTSNAPSLPLSTAAFVGGLPARGNYNINKLNKAPSLTSESIESAGNNTNSLNQVPDLMPSESSWLLQGQQQTPRAAHRLGHQRESSLSSLGSNGPASPFNANISNPQIAVTDSTSDGYHDLTAGGDGNYSYQMGKQPMTLNDSFYTALQQSFGNTHHDTTLLADGLPNMSGSQPQQTNPRLLPAPDFSPIGSSTRSNARSVASSASTVGGDSPATPSYHEPEDPCTQRRRKNGETSSELPIPLQYFLDELDLNPHAYFFGNEDNSCLQDLSDDIAYGNNPNMPKLDRTMTDIYSDELYSPSFTITSASPAAQSQLAMSPTNDLFAQRLQAANSQHLSATQSPTSSSSHSPFRHGSPLAPALNDFAQSQQNQQQQQQQQQAQQVRISSAQQQREKVKQEQDAKALQQHLARNALSQQQGTPSTISPKDAMLEFNENDDSNFPLFPPQETNNFHMDQMTKPAAQQQQSHAFSTAPESALQSAFNFSMPTSIQVPQQYPFISRPNQQQATPSVSTFSRMSSADSNGSDMSNMSTPQRPAKTTADGGTYTCTYHGCTLRFETPALLQKHKREGHRQANALHTARAVSATVSSPGVPDTLLGSQAGPHRCDRINPSTGKPCATVFSRPYDLTRHEDTIHNARKQKVRCNLCTEEKTFSRADALTRHYRVCHPDVEFPGKHRRRGGSAL